MSYIVKVDNTLIDFFAEVGNSFTVKDAKRYRFAGHSFLHNLRDAGLITFKDIGENNEKIWTFTDKGQRIRECFNKAREILREED